MTARTIGIELEYVDAVARDVLPSLGARWRWSLDQTIRNSDGTIPGESPLWAGLRPSSSTVGGEVKTEPWLYQSEVRGEVCAVTAVLKDGGAGVNETTGLQVHVAAAERVSPRQVEQLVRYVHRHGDALLSVAQCSKKRREHQALKIDDRMLLWFEFCAFEPGVLDRAAWTNWRHKTQHPSQPRLDRSLLRRVMISPRQLWRLGTYEFRLWDATLVADKIIEAVALALAITEDIETGYAQADPVALRQRAKEWTMTI